MSMGKERPQRRFGQIAVSEGFCTEADVAQALQVQREEDARGQRHRLIGILMIREGLLSTTHLIEILKTYRQAPAARA